MAPAFAITEWYIHQVDACNGNALIRAWNILAGETPTIPPYQSNMCGHNFQSVVKVRNVDAVSHTVKYRVQVCPASQGGQPLGGPFPIPPCGQIVASGATLVIQPGQEGYLPIWQLQMWSENIRMHNWVVDATSQAVYNCGVCYIANNWCLHPDTGYRADDWYVDITAGTLPTTGHVSVVVYVQGTQPPQAIAGATVTLDGQTLQTNTFGLVDFTVNAGVYSVRVTKSGYNDGYAANIQVPPDRNIEIDLASITPPPGAYTITIHVQDQQGTAVPNATVAVT